MLRTRKKILDEIKILNNAHLESTVLKGVDRKYKEAGLAEESVSSPNSEHYSPDQIVKAVSYGEFLLRAQEIERDRAAFEARFPPYSQDLLHNPIGLSRTQAYEVGMEMGIPEEVMKKSLEMVVLDREKLVKSVKELGPEFSGDVQLRKYKRFLKEFPETMLTNLRRTYPFEEFSLYKPTKENEYLLTDIFVLRKLSDQEKEKKLQEAKSKAKGFIGRIFLRLFGVFF